MMYSGLTSKEALERLKKYGPNEVTQHNKINPFILFINQLKSPLIYILIIAAVFSLFLGEKNDAFFIILVVLLNSFLGFFQEYKAENTLEALKDRVAKHVKVIRDSKKIVIKAENLVPGDLLILQPGLKIPGDGRVVESTELSSNEALLTGESVPVHKISFEHAKKDDPETYMIYKGADIVEGIGVAEITDTGDSTKFGQIAKNLSDEFNPVTPIKQELMRVSKIITVFILLLSAFILVFGISQGISFTEMFLTTVALGVSTIPEGLIIALTITLALGMNRIMAKKAIVKNLPAAETLGDIDVLCVDKTGTLTMGNMQVADTHFTDKEIATKTLAICNNDANYIDRAIAEYIRDNTKKDFLNNTINSRTKLFPFSSLKKYTGAFDGKEIYAVGAPEVIFDFCTNIDKKWKDLIIEKAKQGNRMVSLSYKKTTKSSVDRSDFEGMTFLGIVFVKDPVRQSAIGSLAKIQSAGVDIKVITGDLKDTAISVLHTLSFDINESETLSGKELADMKDGKAFDKKVLKTKLFYRTTPDQKLRIVKSLQNMNKRIGMMGDGVNDAPALKKSEIGISVDSATDVSKEVSDLILLDSNFQTIVDAIEEGRNIFQNLRKIMTYLFADSLSETILIILSLLFNLPLPLLPLQLLWINIIEDGLPSLALSFERSSHNLLNQPPRGRHQSIFDKKVISSILIISLVIDAIYFSIFKTLLEHNYPLEKAQTIIFAGVALSSLLFLFSAKTIDSNIWKENIFNNKMVNISVIFGLTLLALTIYWTPLQSLLSMQALNAKEVGFIFTVAIFDTLIVEIIKYFTHIFHSKIEE